jgi:oligopeptide/dipeptide ABC transporter ATP-binding protein
MTKTLLEVKNLKKHFPIKGGLFRRTIGFVKAVDDISFTINESETVGLVGESGSGKSTAGLSILRLIEPTDGVLSFYGKDLRLLSHNELRAFRKIAAIIFQDPLSSLSPRKTVLDNMGEALLYHGLVKTREEMIEKVGSILKKIGLPQDAMFRYPHQFSGGQQQRISIGRAIGLEPKLLVCDEVVSALDQSIQAQILNLLLELKNSMGLSLLFVSHDLSVVRHTCDRILVMYRGKIVESGKTEEVFANPRHPYTQMLFASMPKRHPRDKKLLVKYPNEMNTKGSTGCPFFARCPVARAACKDFTPPLKNSGTQEHTYSCVH